MHITLNFLIFKQEIQERSRLKFGVPGADVVLFCHSLIRVCELQQKTQSDCDCYLRRTHIWENPNIWKYKQFRTQRAWALPRRMFVKHFYVWMSSYDKWLLKNISGSKDVNLVASGGGDCMILCTTQAQKPHLSCLKLVLWLLEAFAGFPFWANAEEWNGAKVCADTFLKAVPTSSRNELRFYCSRGLLEHAAFPENLSMEHIVRLPEEAISGRFKVHMNWTRGRPAAVGPQGRGGCVWSHLRIWTACLEKHAHVN